MNVRGLVRNPAAPADLLLHLLATDQTAFTEGLRERRTPLPRVVQEAMMADERRGVRGALAGSRHVDPDLRDRLLDDPDWLVMLRAFGDADDPPLPGEATARVLARTAADEPGQLMTVNEVRFELEMASAYTFIDRPDPEEPPDEVDDVEGMARDRYWSWTLISTRLARGVIDGYLAADDHSALRYVASNRWLPPDVVETLLRHPDADVRESLARRPDLTREQALRLAAAPEITVRTVVSVHPVLTEADRAGIVIDPGPAEPYRPLSTGPRRRPVDDAAAKARSVNPLLRRDAAIWRGLPDDLVTLLADDPDEGVRHRLATCHPAAPPALLLRRYLESDLDRERLRDRPRFPVEGLAAYATHDDPELRLLAARDPHATPEVIEALLQDPDPGVRAAMASCPRLPEPRIVALLDDPELGEHAAANPALPADRMWAVIA